jgi:hypothetical protein
LIYCKNFCKCHNVPPPSTTIKKGKQDRYDWILKMEKISIQIDMQIKT